MTDTVRIREMTAEDLRQVAGLEAACFTVPWSEALLRDCLSDSFDKLWVLELLSDHSPAPALGGYCNFRMIAGEGELMRIAVAPAFRGRGLARDLMEVLAACARENRVSEVTLEVRASNLSAINLYKSCGFQIEAVRRSYYTCPVEDALIMWNRKV